MKTSFKKVLPMLLVLTLPAVVQAQFNYTANNGTITITHYTGSGGAVVIPDFITVGNTNLPVTSIGAYAFNQCYSLIDVTIPNSVVSIGDGAFLSCTNLINVTIGDSVSTIAHAAFYACGLTSVTLPRSFSSLGDLAISGCGSLTAIMVDPANAMFSSVDGVLFNKSQTTLVQYPTGKAGSYTISNSVTSIGPAAFARCSRLTSVTIPDSVTSTGLEAFNYCFSLTNVTIGSGLTNIGRSTFYYCNNLTNVTIPASVTSIGDFGLADTSLAGVYFQGNAPSLGGTYVFLDDYNATVYYLPGTTNWGATFGGRPTALWKPQVQTGDASLGVRTNQFGFNINWASGQTVVVEACTNLAHPTWSPVGTNTLTGGLTYFSDPQWANYPARFYRLRWP